ncbi:DoxX family protein [Microlunatus parietis]|uniref:DoxX-like family protein n=1 Tax=Microlunatus parietis TaxID=682979 RepID=A0A7Y9I9S6_9ACTN|nr:DoxX family protein [Microlunatus parietis]NYE72822.1 hypothetical protein [Microlunatus parietis]
MSPSSTRALSAAAADTSAANLRTGGIRHCVRTLLFWAATLAIGYELASGAVWNLLTIDWIEAQLRHLGYPDYLAYVLGVWQAGAAVVIMVPGLPLIKEWAYVGAFFLWSGAVVSHLVLGGGFDLWGVPLIFALLAIVSWALRPADRRLVGRSAGPRTHSSDHRAWLVTLGLVVLLYAV